MFTVLTREFLIVLKMISVSESPDLCNRPKGRRLSKENRDQRQQQRQQWQQLRRQQEELRLYT